MLWTHRFFNLVRCDDSTIEQISAPTTNEYNTILYLPLLHMKLDNLVTTYEQRLPIVWYEGYYEVSDLWRIRSLKRATTSGKLLKPSIRRNYYFVSLSKDNTKKNMPVHRAVCTSFIPNEYNKPYINHKDCDKLNNSLSNLERCTASENDKHAFRMWRKDLKGEKHNMAKLKNEDISFIRKNKLVFSQKEMAEKYNVSVNTVADIIKRRRRSHLP